MVNEGHFTSPNFIENSLFSGKVYVLSALISGCLGLFLHWFMMIIPSNHFETIKNAPVRIKLVNLVYFSCYYIGNCLLICGGVYGIYLFDAQIVAANLSTLGWILNIGLFLLEYTYSTIAFTIISSFKDAKIISPKIEYIWYFINLFQVIALIIVAALFDKFHKDWEYIFWYQPMLACFQLITIIIYLLLYYLTNNYCKNFGVTKYIFLNGKFCFFSIFIFSIF